MTSLTFRTPAVLGRAYYREVLDSFFNDPHHIKKSTDGYPLTDIYKDEEDKQIIEMALAGFSKKDIQIKSQNNKITISYSGTIDEALESLEGKPKRKRQRRIAKRAFEKTFVDYNNQLDFTQSKATFVDGLLRIVIPNHESNIPNTIVIE